MLHFLTGTEKKRRQLERRQAQQRRLRDVSKRSSAAAAAAAAATSAAVAVAYSPPQRDSSPDFIDLSAEDLLPLLPYPLLPHAPPAAPSSPLLPSPATTHFLPCSTPSTSSSTTPSSSSSSSSPAPLWPLLQLTSASPSFPTDLVQQFAEAERRVGEAHWLLSSLQPRLAELEEGKATAVLRRVEAALAESQRQVMVEREEKERAVRAAVAEAKVREESELRLQADVQRLRADREETKAAMRRVHAACEQLSTERAELQIAHERLEREANVMRRRLDWWEGQERRAAATRMASKAG